MAVPVRKKTTNSGGATVPNITPDTVTHKNGDLLIVTASKFAAGDTLSTATAGWIRQEYVASGGGVLCSSALFYKVASSSSEPMPQIDSSTSDKEMMVTVYVVEDADASNIIGTSSQGYAVNFSTDTVTTDTDNALVMQFVFAEDDIKKWQFQPPANQISCANDGDRLSASCAWFTQVTKGTTVAQKVFCGTTIQDYTHITIAIADSGTTAEPCVDPASTTVSLVHPMSTTSSSGYLSNGNIADIATRFGTDQIDNQSPVYEAIAGRNPMGDGDAYDLSTVGLLLSTGDYNQLKVGGIALANPTDISNSILTFMLGSSTNAGNVATYDVGGHYFGFTDGTNISLWKVSAKDTVITTKAGAFNVEIDTSTAPYYTKGTLNLSAVTEIVIGVHATSSHSIDIGSIWKIDKSGYLPIIGGSSTNPASLTALKSLSATGGFGVSLHQRSFTDGQILVGCSISFGNGTDKTILKTSNQSLAFAKAYDEAGLFVAHNIPEGALQLRINASDADDIDLSSTTIDFVNYGKFVISASTSQLANYNLDGLVLLNVNPTLNPLGYAVKGLTLIGGKEITYTTLANLSGGCTFRNFVSAQVITITNKADFEKLQNCDFSGNKTAIKITGDQTDTGGKWQATGIKMSGNTLDIEYTGTTAFTIVVDEGQLWSKGGSGATNLTLEAPTVLTGVSFTKVEPDTQILIVPTGQVGLTARANALFIDDSVVGTSVTYSVPYVADQTVDITIYKLGFTFKRLTDITLGNSVIPIQGNQEVDRSYVASSGLTYGSNMNLDFANSQVQLFAGTTSTIQNYVSYIKELWIAAPDVTNFEFMFKASSDDSFDLINDWTIRAGDEVRLYGDGARQITSGDIIQDVFISLISAGDTTGMQGRYQLTDKTTDPIDTWNTPAQSSLGNVDQIIKVLEPPTLDSTYYLCLKYQVNGYETAEVDVVAQYGTLLDKPYVVALEPKPIDGMVLGDPLNAITVIDHGDTPVTWKGKQFSITIQDDDDVSGDLIHRYINYHLSQGGLFNTTGINCFRVPDMVYEYGDGYETRQGEWLGTAEHTSIVNNLKGIRVVMSDGVTEHPDFIQHQSDDGSYYVKPVTALGKITGLVAGSNVYIRNETKGTNTYNAIVAGTSYTESYTDGTTYSDGDTLTIYVAYQSGTTAKLLQTIPVSVTSTGWSALANQKDDTVYNTNAIDGSTVIGYSADYVADADGLNIDIQITGSTFNIKEGYAWYVYNLMTANGIKLFHDVMYAKDTANYVLDASVADVKLDNLGNQNLLETSNANLSRTDGADPRRNPPSMGYGISMNTANVLTVNVGGSALTSAENAQLMALPTNPALATDLAEVKTRLDLDATNPNIYADDGSSIANSDFTLTKTDNGNGTSTVQRS